MNSPSKPACRLVVVGGGISGLAAAHRLLERASGLNRAVRLDLLEAGHRLGGVIHTAREQGFLLEGGPDSFVSEKPWAVDLCRRLGLEANLIGASPRHRPDLYRAGREAAACSGGVPPDRPLPIRLLCRLSPSELAGKIRMAADLVLPRRRPHSANHDESLAAFVRRRLGEEALQRLAQPLVGGIYTADPEKLGLRATFPQFLDMEERHRSLLLAMRRERKRQPSSADGHPAGPRYGLFVSLDQGLQLLVDRLRESLPAPSIHLGCRVVSLRRPNQARRWEIELEKGPPIRADGICLALPAHRSADLLEALDPGLAARLRSVDHASTATVNLAYRAADVPAAMDGFGFLVPAVEEGAMLACSYSHRKFAGRAPGKAALLRAFVGGALHPERLEGDDRELVARVRRTLETLLGITRPPLLSRVERHPEGIPQYGVGHLELVARIESRMLQWPSLQLAGNGLTGIGIPDCVRRAEQCADRLLETLAG